MKELATKLKTVYTPFLIIAISTIIIYTLLRWIFDIRLSVLTLKQDILDLWLPFAIPWIPTTIWLRRPIRVLQVKGKDGNGYFFYQMIAAFAITGTLVVTQNYIKKAGYELIQIEDINQISEHSNERYFKIDSFHVERHQAVPFATARTSGKHNQDLTFYLYVACPLGNNCWYGIKYQQTIKNRGSDGWKNEQYQKFIQRKGREFETYKFKPVEYFVQTPYSDDRDGFLDAIRRVNSNIDEKLIKVLEPERQSFESRMGNNFEWIFGSFGIGGFIFLLMTIIPRINESELKRLRSNKPLKEDALRDMLVYFNPMGKFPVTAILLNINIAIFIYTIGIGLNPASPSARDLLELGGNRSYEFQNGEYWRLFTSMFLHSGIMHLLMNLFGLGLTSSLLEPILRSKGLILCYLICGIVASVASASWNDNIVSVGASGAIFGLTGIILSFNISKIFSSYSGLIWFMLAFYGGLNLLLGFILNGVDNAAHFGGLAAGVIIGFLIASLNRNVLIKKPANRN